jgi:hypothetical protein
LNVFDLSHQWASDLSIGPTGDLALASGSMLGQQRVLRRLMTNPGDYIWQLGYGAGLGQFIGQPTNASQIQAVIRSQKQPWRARLNPSSACNPIPQAAPERSMCKSATSMLRPARLKCCPSR